MSWLNILSKARTLFGHMVIHPLVILATFWFCGLIVSFITNEYGAAIGLNLNALSIAYKWSSWLLNSWSTLGFSAYNHIKIKLILALFGPPFCVILYYIKYFNRIKSLEFFKQKESVYGSADWATQADIERANLREKHGMLLGVDSGGYFVADGFQHALLFAPTGSGKGVGFVIPNLLFWNHSVVVHDIKLENHQLTSGWRAKQGQKVYV